MMSIGATMVGSFVRFAKLTAMHGKGHTREDWMEQKGLLCTRTGEQKKAGHVHWALVGLAWKRKRIVAGPGYWSAGLFGPHLLGRWPAFLVGCCGVKWASFWDQYWARIELKNVWALSPTIKMPYGNRSK